MIHRIRLDDPVLSRFGKLFSAVITGVVVAFTIEWFRKRKPTSVAWEDPIIKEFNKD